MNTRNLTFAIISAALLAGCASTPGRYPSLAVRDVERAEGRFEPVEIQQLDVPPVEVDLTGGLDARLSALVAQASEAHALFRRSQTGATQIVAAAAGSPVGSDAWAAAQVALADLDSARSVAAIALGDLDILSTAAAVEGSDRSAIDAARASVIAMISEEDEVLAALRSQVR